MRGRIALIAVSLGHARAACLARSVAAALAALLPGALPGALPAALPGTRLAAAVFAAAFAAALAAPLTACGFHLRASQPLPFASLYLSFGPNSPLGTELARTIRAGTPTVVTTERAKAQAIFEVQSETREREVLSVNAQGQPVEYQLRVRLTFRVHDGKGRDFIAPTQLLAQRDISFNETQILAKESEESLLYRDMQTDLVQQLLRRLAAAKI